MIFIHFSTIISNIGYSPKGFFLTGGNTIKKLLFLFLLLVFAVTFFVSALIFSDTKDTATKEAYSEEYPEMYSDKSEVAQKGLSNDRQKTSKKPGKSNPDLLLVSKSHPLSSDYVPANLKGVLDSKGSFIVPAKNSHITLKSEVLQAAARMFKAAEIEGINGFIISSGYRPYSEQNFFYTKKVNYYRISYGKKEAEEKAAAIVAPPGKSEHQTGLAMDITTRDLLKTGNHLVEAFAGTPQGIWINKNCWKYGFVIRYQAGKENLTGIISEPWHLRYVGKSHSKAMFEKKLCLEEYLSQL